MLSCLSDRSRSLTSRTASLQLEQLESRNVPSTGSLTAAAGIVNSAENYSDFIGQEYQRFLGRTADDDGMAYWLGQMEQGATAEMVEAGITASPEYFQNRGNDSVDWLQGLYGDLLQRPADADGMNYWLNQLDNGASPFDVAQGFTYSVERETQVITEDYVQFLGRAPEAGAVDYWMGQIAQGASRADVAVGIVGSDEYYQNAGNDPVTFVENIYNDVLGRAPDNGELSYWVSVVDSN
jgi:hypothetical protein